MSWLESREAIQSRLRKIDKAVVLVTKDHWFWRAIASVLAFFRLMEYSRFMRDFATTLGPIQAYPAHWSAPEVEEIGVHESRHTKQCRWFGLGISPWLGLIPMGIAYLLLPLPIGLAWCRYRLELDAEAQLWKYELANGIGEAAFWWRVCNTAMSVSSSSYGFSVPRSWALWGYKKKARKILAGYLVGQLSLD